MFGLFNYAPKDFIGKSPEYILDKMKPTKIDDDFFAKYDKPENADFKLLTPSIKAAIQLLIDLKKKMVIYEKCYNKNGSTQQAPTMNAPPMHSVRHSIKPGHPAQMQMQAPQPGKEEIDAPINMEGGRRRRSRKSKKMRKGTRSKSKGTRSKGRKTRGGKKKW